MNTKQMVFDRLEAAVRQIAQRDARIEELQKILNERLAAVQTLNADLAVARQEVDRVRQRRDALSAMLDKRTMGDKFITELYRAAESFIVSVPQKNRKDAIIRLDRAIASATEHVDLIPF